MTEAWALTTFLIGVMLGVAVAYLSPCTRAWYIERRALKRQIVHELEDMTKKASDNWLKRLWAWLWIPITYECPDESKGGK